MNEHFQFVCVLQQANKMSSYEMSKRRALTKFFHGPASEAFKAQVTKAVRDIVYQSDDNLALFQKHHLDAEVHSFIDRIAKAMRIRLYREEIRDAVIGAWRRWYEYIVLNASKEYLQDAMVDRRVHGRYQIHSYKNDQHLINHLVRRGLVPVDESKSIQGTRFRKEYIELRLRLYAQYGRDADADAFMKSLIPNGVLTQSELVDYQDYYERYKESMEYGAPGLFV